jgi:hypothetical protein
MSRAATSLLGAPPLGSGRAYIYFENGQAKKERIIPSFPEPRRLGVKIFPL